MIALLTHVSCSWSLYGTGVFFPIPGNDKTDDMRSILGYSIRREVNYK